MKALSRGGYEAHRVARRTKARSCIVESWSEGPVARILRVEHQISRCCQSLDTMLVHGFTVVVCPVIRARISPVIRATKFPLRHLSSIRVRQFGIPNYSHDEFRIELDVSRADKTKLNS